MRNGFQILLLGFLMSVFSLAAENGVETWSQRYGGAGTENAFGIAQAPDNGYIVVGQTDSAGAGVFDFWLVRLDEKGAKLWEKTLGGPGADEARAVQAAPDGGFVVAGTTRSQGSGGKDFMAARLDSTGNVVWQKSFGGPGSDTANSIDLTADGGCVIAGMTMSFPAGNKNAWVLKLDAKGDKLWEKVIGGPRVEVANSIRQTRDAGFIMAGYAFSANTRTIDVWVVKLDRNGDVVWQKTLGGGREDRANAVIQTADNGYALAGTSWSYGSGDFDYWIIKLDRSGERVWDKTYGGSKWDEAWDIKQTADNGFIVIGSTRSYGDINKDLMILNLDQDGEKLWSKIYGGAGFDYGHSLALTRDGGFVVAGSAQNPGEKTPDFWVLKLDGNGECGGVGCVKPRQVAVK